MARRSRTPCRLRRRRRIPPHLTEGIINEILLRFPPDDPAVCRTWQRILTEPTFAGRYRAFHRRPPLLGVLHHRAPNFTRFVRTTTSSFRPTIGRNARDMLVLDCHHGRVPVLYDDSRSGELVVWDPITGDQKQIPVPEHPHIYCTGAVLCAVAGCDHLGCCGGPFHVVFVGSGLVGTWASMYSSETGVWSAPALANVGPNSYVRVRPSNLTGDALYFELEMSKRILKFDLGERTLSVINRPQVYDQRCIVMTAEDGEVGFACVEGNSLHLWSWEDGDEEIAGWMLRRVIELDGLIPIRNVSVLPDLIGFVEGTHTIFISTDAGVFTLDLKSMKVRKVGKVVGYVAVLPYTSFYAPVHARG